MVIQDTLISHNWNREAAQKQLDMDHPVPKLAYVGDAGPAHDGPLDGNRQNEDGEATVLKVSKFCIYEHQYSRQSTARYSSYSNSLYISTRLFNAILKTCQLQV